MIDRAIPEQKKKVKDGGPAGPSRVRVRLGCGVVSHLHGGQRRRRGSKRGALYPQALPRLRRLPSLRRASKKYSNMGFNSSSSSSVGKRSLARRIVTSPREGKTKTDAFYSAQPPASTTTSKTGNSCTTVTVAIGTAAASAYFWACRRELETPIYLDTQPRSARALAVHEQLHNLLSYLLRKGPTKRPREFTPHQRQTNGGPRRKTRPYSSHPSTPVALCSELWMAFCSRSKCSCSKSPAPPPPRSALPTRAQNKARTKTNFVEKKGVSLLARPTHKHINVRNAVVSPRSSPVSNAGRLPYFWLF